MNPIEHDENEFEQYQSQPVESDNPETILTEVGSSLDHELLLDGMTLAGGYVEGGIHDFSDYATLMINDLGPDIMPYLLSFWESLRHYPGLDTQSMTDVYSSEKLYEELLSEHSNSRSTLSIRQELSPQMVESIKKERQNYEDEGVMHNREMHYQILATWKRNSPQMTKRLKNLQVLDDMAFVSQERMWQSMEDYRAGGMPPTDAREQAEREHLMLEPESPR